jgi:RNA polymerase sigma-B factor
MPAPTTILHDHLSGPVAEETSPPPTPANNVQELLRQRGALPAGHPDRIVLRARCVEAGLPLARSLAARYRGRGEPLDDLYQVASLALMQAVDRYDPDLRTAFTSFAIPTILGALKRHFRDNTWRMRVPRPVQDLAIRLAPAGTALAQQLGRTPTRQDLAAHLATTEEDIAEALSAWRAHYPESLDALPKPGREDRPPLIDTLGAIDSCLDAVPDRQAVRSLLAALPLRQRRILAMRYFGDLTQAEIATEVGISQMHVSRLLARTLADLRAIVRATSDIARSDPSTGTAVRTSTAPRAGPAPLAATGGQPAPRSIHRPVSATGTGLSPAAG